MDCQKLAGLLFPAITNSPEDFEAKYPPRALKDGAHVTRIAPSPTGFMHLGNLFGAMADERLAHQSGGVFYLRIEDTDQKREVEGGVETILGAFKDFDLSFDEGASLDGDIGAFGPYRQRQRATIYQTYAKWLVERGRAYPCFCTEEDLNQMRLNQQEQKLTPGYWGEWAKHRDFSLAEVEEKLKSGAPYVIRFRSNGDPKNRVKLFDLARGELDFPENDQDVVLLKSDGIPTYHFAHVIDDHLMRTTHVVRGEEWLSTLPVHVELFSALGFPLPQYVHTPHLMKLDGGGKRKLSKRKDPELALSFYHEQGYPISCVKEYLMTLLNSNFEQWRIETPDAPLDDFAFKAERMGTSGALFDLDKLNDVSKSILARLRADEVYDGVLSWAKTYDPAFFTLIEANRDYLLEILAIGRGGAKPRRDITFFSGVKEYVSFFFPELFAPDYTLPERISREDCMAILTQYKDLYLTTDDAEAWFGKIKELAASLGFAPETKLFKKNPESYKGHVGDVSMALRVAITGRQNSPDMFEVFKIMGADMVKARISRAIEAKWK